MLWSLLTYQAISCLSTELKNFFLRENRGPIHIQNNVLSEDIFQDILEPTYFGTPLFWNPHLLEPLKYFGIFEICENKVFWNFILRNFILSSQITEIQLLNSLILEPPHSGTSIFWNPHILEPPCTFWNPHGLTKVPHMGFPVRQGNNTDFFVM